MAIDKTKAEVRGNITLGRKKPRSTERRRRPTMRTIFLSWPLLPLPLCARPFTELLSPMQLLFRVDGPRIRGGLEGMKDETGRQSGSIVSLVFTQLTGKYPSLHSRKGPCMNCGLYGVGHSTTEATSPGFGGTWNSNSMEMRRFMKHRTPPWPSPSPTLVSSVVKGTKRANFLLGC